MRHLALVCCFALAVSSASAQDDQIKSLLEKYVKSVNAADTKLGAEVWDTSASLIHPMGHEKGWEQIKTNFYENVMGKMFTKRELTAKDIAIHTLGDAAWLEFNWDFTATLSANSQPMTSKGRETQVLKKTDRGWRVLHVHYSIPFTPPAQ
jgi:uncharacterized protein (TIGR02246 family)